MDRCRTRLQAARGDQPAATPGQRPARSTILIWLSGGTSHIDTFDLKPKAAREFRGGVQPARSEPLEDPRSAKRTEQDEQP
jgi:hypothetical protein